MIGLTMPITKHNFQVRDPNKLAETIIKAYKISVTGRPGPVYIDLPKDVQSMEVTKPIPKDVKIRGLKAPPKPDIRKIKKAVEYLLDAQRPLLLLGVLLVVIGIQLFSSGFLAELLIRQNPNRSMYTLREVIENT